MGGRGARGPRRALPGATLGAVGERLRVLVESSRTPTGAGPISVTVSIGATLARREDTPETLVARADGLMYRAKAAGRDQVAVEA